MTKKYRLTRRKFVWTGLALPLVVAGCGSQTATSPATLAPTTSAPQPSATATQLQPTAITAPTQAVANPTPVPPTAVPTQALPTATKPVPTAVPATATTAAPAQVLAPTAACQDNDDPTPAETEGPYFTANSPKRISLIEAGTGGTKLVLTGYVFSTTCKPLANAKLDFWQADDKGVYDNSGYKMRGHQFTDANGRFTLETVVPGLYPGRTRHIHVKVQAPNQPVLTSQLYFPGEARNQSDSLYNKTLLMKIQDVANIKQASFDFVLKVP